MTESEATHMVEPRRYGVYSSIAPQPAERAVPRTIPRRMMSRRRVTGGTAP
jgi:hypothetical protein